MGGTGSTSTGGTSGSPSTVMSPATIPTWASSLLSSASSGGPTANLGFPSSSMAPATTVGGNMGQTGPSAGNTAAGFQSAPLPTGDANIPTIGGRAPPPVAAPAAAPAAAPVADAAPPADPNAQVFVYTQPSWGYDADWKQNGPTPYQDAGVFSTKGQLPDMEAAKTFGRGWGPAIMGYGQGPQPTTGPYGASSAGLKPGDAVSKEQLDAVPHMSKTLYDTNMAAYGNPYGPAAATRDQQYYNYLLHQQGLGGLGAGGDPRSGGSSGAPN